eukprot:TRINITY_DN2723_c0_g2_i1.p1 TRINITY_DN2723_c0_g2~~TRINITY_DN2723_c0_g2_i1.p1  ORF type:complete len:520 (-),score=121.37 TRINITY_DN2723_c0_g2_i1:64-1623(-)
MADQVKLPSIGQSGADNVVVPDISANELITTMKIGSGCFGTVYKGTCRGKTVAIKKLHQQDLEENVMDEFKKEIAILAHLRHPNVILFLGACTERGHLAIVTEFLTRGDMHQVVHNKSIAESLTLLRRLNMAKDVAQGMNWLHCSKPPIIHRDLKPNNLLVDDNWNVKICDFGLSAFQFTKTLQDNGVAPGTPLWMAPEVLQGQPLSEKADIYSYGIVLWEMLTGKEPFEEHDDYNTFVKAVCEEGERPSLPEDMHPCLKKLLEDCWQPKADKRPSFEEIIARLNVAMVDCTITNDSVASTMWKKNWSSELQTTWAQFSTVLYKELNETLARDRERNINYKCMQKVLATEGDRDSELVVTLERFGLFLKWFGPLTGQKVSIFDRVTNLLKQPWFHGDIERQACENLLSSFKKGTFLVRFSLTEPDRTPFTISKVNKNGAINHQRVYVQPDGKGYYVHVKYKSGTKKVEVPGSFEALFKKVKSDLRLKTVCPGSQYLVLFSASKVDGYLPSPEDDDDDSD